MRPTIEEPGLNSEGEQNRPAAAHVQGAEPSGQETPAPIEASASHLSKSEVTPLATGSSAQTAPSSPAVPDIPMTPVAVLEAAPASEAGKATFVAAYEHSAMVRFCHWLNAVALVIMITSGWRIFIAFPSFGPKLPEHRLLRIPDAITLGGWLGGALQWHYTFMWVFAATGLAYAGYLIASGEYKTMLFRPRDIPGVWPMACHYFFFGPEPKQTEAYNPLQKLAYTTIVLCGALSVLTGIVILRPVQFSGMAWLMGGFHLARIWHFVAMCGFVAFIPGHLVMVALHGWNNFMSMVRGWKKNPEYL